MRLPLLAAASLATVLALQGPAVAGSAWDELKPMLYGTRVVEEAHGLVQFEAPRRAEDDRRVPVSVKAGFADGRTVKSVAFVLDENPMPVAATFRFDKPEMRVGLGIQVRLNGPTPVRVVVEASDGRLYMASQMVKTSGLGACAAPPVGDPKLALKTLGEMTLSDANDRGGAAEATLFQRRARLDIKHPNHTGMQMDQITLLYIPARYLSEVEVRQGDERLFHVETGFAMSENPHIEFDYRGADTIAVHIKDTDGATFDKEFPRKVGG